MNFIDFIKTHLSEVDDFTELSMKVGYRNQAIEKGALRIKSILHKPLLGIEEEDGYFDGTFGCRSLVIALMKHFIAPHELINEAEHDINIILEDVEQMKRNRAYLHIFVDTGFKRNNEPIFVLGATNHLRYIRNLKHLYSLPLDEQIAKASNILQQHFLAKNGELPVWGTIQRYHYRYAESEPAIVFDTDGQVIGNSEFIEPKAIVSVGCKDISPLLKYSA